MEIAGGAALHRSWRDEFNTSFQVQSALEGKPVRTAIFYANFSAHHVPSLLIGSYL